MILAAKISGTYTLHLDIEINKGSSDLISTHNGTKGYFLLKTYTFFHASSSIKGHLRMKFSKKLDFNRSVP